MKVFSFFSQANRVFSDDFWLLGFKQEFWEEFYQANLLLLPKFIEIKKGS